MRKPNNVKVFFFTLGLIPFSILIGQLFTGNLGANPVEKMLHQTGLWSLRWLLLTLTVTPLRRLLRWNKLINFRRMLGLFAFFYGLLHFLVYLIFDFELALAKVIPEIIQRPFITAGFISLLIMLPLAATSTKGMIRRLGGKRWQQIHRLVYLSAIAAVIHFLWSVKADSREPQIYAFILAILLLARLFFYLHKRFFA